MCGRYYFDVDDEELKEVVQKVQNNENMDFNTGEIYPTNVTPIITAENIILAKWGFPNPKRKGYIINARVETLMEKYMFKNLVNTKRCIVPASAYFEWKIISDNSKQKTKYIIRKPNSILYMAGLYNTFKNHNKQLSLFDDDYEDTIQFTIITKEANPSVSFIHNRMPLIFSKEEMQAYLQGKDLHELLYNNKIILEYAIS
jgi:putative SOS response-associated peptidase YedK